MQNNKINAGQSTAQLRKQNISDVVSTYLSSAFPFCPELIIFLIKKFFYYIYDTYVIHNHEYVICI